MAQHRHRSRRDDLGADDGPHQGGLPAARGPQQPGDGAARNLHGQVPHGVALTAGHLEFLDADRRLGVPFRKFIIR